MAEWTKEPPDFSKDYVVRIEPGPSPFINPPKGLTPYKPTPGGVVHDRLMDIGTDAGCWLGKNVGRAVDFVWRLGKSDSKPVE